VNIADILGLGPKPPPTIDAARGMIERHPENTNLVRFVKRT